MMQSNLIRAFVLIVLVGGCLILLSSDVAAQCAMCRSGVSQAFAKNLSVAIIVLLAPPVTIFSAIFYIAFKNRKG